MMLRKILRVAFVLSVTGIAVAGCGRKAPLDTPAPGQSLFSAPPEGEEDAQKPAVPEKRFILDPLL